MKKGFVRGCRPWFGIDGCHLKGPFGGILLFVVSLDANRGCSLLQLPWLRSRIKTLRGIF